MNISMWRQGLEGLRTWASFARPAENSFARLVREEDGTLRTPGLSRLTGPASPGTLVTVPTLQLWREASERIDQSIAIVERLQNLMELVPRLGNRPALPFLIQIPDPFPVEEEEAIYRNLFFVSGVDLSTPGDAPWIGPAPIEAPPRSEEDDEVDEGKVPGSPPVE